MVELLMIFFTNLVVIVMKGMMDILLVSPYHGGSHRVWAEGYREYSEHRVDLLTLPARFWKWRMHGGAVTLARRFMEGGKRPNLILTTDMLDLTTFLALTRRQSAGIPTVLYMHENQLTYPLPEDGRSGPMRRQLGERDRHYAFINYASMLAADAVFFNSQYHHTAFFAALRPFLKHFPEYNELGSIHSLKAKSRVLAVGIDLRRLDTEPVLSPEITADPAPLIVWNQRWEYDKNPAAFFEALFVLAGEGVPFRLALCGQQYGKRPLPFEVALSRLSGQIIHAGYAPEEQYKELLAEAAVTVSTADHEFFGISILEAIYARAFPILPRRLSYPELIPQPFHEACLYQDEAGLLERLRWALRRPEEAQEIAAQLATAVAIYDWSNLAPRYDQILAELGDIVHHA